MLRKMGQKKRIAGKKNRWKKSKIGASLAKCALWDGTEVTIFLAKQL